MPPRTRRQGGRGGGQVDPGDVIMYFPTYSYLIIVNKYKSFTVFSLLPKFLQVQVRSRRKVVLGDAVGVKVGVVVKLIQVMS